MKLDLQNLIADVGELQKDMKRMNQKDKEIVSMAVQSNGNALRFADASLQKNKDIVMLVHLGMTGKFFLDTLKKSAIKLGMI